MSHHLLGQLSALGAAVTWALAVVLFKKSGESLPPVALNLFKNVVGLVLLAATFALFGDGLLMPPGATGRDVVILAISGFLGIAVADTFFFYGLRLAGVGIVTVAEATYSPFAILFSWWLLAETLRASHYLGGALIVAAVVVVARHPPPPDRTPAQVAAGVVCAVAAMATMAFGIVLAKPVLERTPLVWATAVRLGVGSAALALLWAATPKRHELLFLLRPTRTWWLTLPASVLGAYVALLLWTAGFKYTWASVAAILNQTSIVFALLLAAPMLGEALTRRKLLAAALALTGVVVTLG